MLEPVAGLFGIWLILYLVKIEKKKKSLAKYIKKCGNQVECHWMDSHYYQMDVQYYLLWMLN